MDVPAAEQTKSGSHQTGKPRACSQVTASHETQQVTKDTAIAVDKESLAIVHQRQFGTAWPGQSLKPPRMLG